MSISLASQRMASRLEELKDHSLLRELSLARGVNLCSNDYLGLSTDPRLKLALLECIEQQERVSSTGSRLLSGHSAAWEELETRFAKFAGTDAALYFNSGFSANIGLLSSVVGSSDAVFSDALNHASLIDGMRLSRARRVIYPHCDLDFLEHELQKAMHGSNLRVIVTESIFSMDGDRAPLHDIFQLAEQYNAEVIVDEAHATGACGPQGRGLTAELSLQDKALAIVHTCGKALAGMGAFVCGSNVLKQFLINHARSLIFSTAMPPYLAGQIDAALKLAVTMDGDRNHLSALAAHLRERLTSIGLNCGASSSHIVPLMIGSNEDALRIAAQLQERGFAVRAIRSPSVPPGTARLRLSLTAKLNESDIDRFSDALAEFWCKAQAEKPRLPLISGSPEREKHLATNT